MLDQISHHGEIQRHPIPTLIFWDFNAKNHIWGGLRTYDRGESTGEFILTNDIIALIDPKSSPTFSSTNGNSWIDLTLITNDMFKKVHSWEVLNENSSSNHNYILIKLFEDHKTQRKKLADWYKRHYRNVKETTRRNPWWSPELEMERKRTRALRRRYQQCNNPLRETLKTILSGVSEEIQNTSQGQHGILAGVLLLSY